tara:strand:+ start:896 stop:1771 length:876 start_codon:yes stop_codon:yes gene_type:complete
MTPKQSDLVATVRELASDAPTVRISRSRYGYEVDGERFRRVTTLLGGIPKPALVGWGIKSVAEFAISHKDQWEDLPKADALKLLKGSPYSKRDEAGDRGTAVHNALEALVKGQPLPTDLTDEEEAYAASATAFLNARNSKPLSTEMIVFNKTHGYCGTLDLWDCDEEGTPWILDYKTSSGVYPEHAVQQVAYQRAEWALVQKKQVPNGKGEAWEGKLIPWSPDYCQRLGIVHVAPEHATLYEVCDADRLWEVFLAASLIKDWLLATDSFAGKTPREQTFLDPITLERGDDA